MRKGSFEKTQPARPTGREENSELAQAFLRLRKSSKSDQPSSSDEQSSSCQPPDSDQQVSSAGSEQNCCQLNESDRLPSPPQHPSFDQQPDCDQYSSPSQYINCQQQIDVSQQPDSKQENEQCDGKLNEGCSLSHMGTVLPFTGFCSERWENLERQDVLFIFVCHCAVGDSKVQ